jgi:hypothetical protein
VRLAFLVVVVLACVTVPKNAKWAELDHDQRAKFMAQVVVPKMKPLFQAFDPKRFAEFDCRTCHGEGAEHDVFRMPNAQLFALPKSREGLKPEWVKFMTEQVKPQMTEILGVSGFACESCHPTR